jgi:hypothetical protein
VSVWDVTSNDARIRMAKTVMLRVEMATSEML